MIFFAFLGNPGKAARGFMFWLSYLRDPNKPLSYKIVFFLAPFIITFIVYKFRNLKNSNNNTTKLPKGIKACPYCGAEYGKEMNVCPVDQTTLVLK
jgi:hypothetical protein